MVRHFFAFKLKKRYRHSLSPIQTSGAAKPPERRGQPSSAPTPTIRLKSAIFYKLYYMSRQIHTVRHIPFIRAMVCTQIAEKPQITFQTVFRPTSAASVLSTGQSAFGDNPLESRFLRRPGPTASSVPCTPRREGQPRHPA